MSVDRLGQTERALQEDLSSGAVEQVGAAGDMGDRHRGVVDHDGELIRPGSVAAAEHEVTDLARDVLAAATEHAIVEADLASRHAPAQARRSIGMARRRATGAGVDRLGAVRRDRAVAQLFAGAGAWIGVEPLERGLVPRVPLGLPVGPMRTADVGAFVPVEAEPAKVVELAALVLGLAALGIEIFDAQDEHPTRGSGLQPREQGGADVAEVEAAARARSVAATQASRRWGVTGWGRHGLGRGKKRLGSGFSGLSSVQQTAAIHQRTPSLTSCKELTPRTIGRSSALRS